MTATQRKRRERRRVKSKRRRRRTKWYDVGRGNVRVPVWAVCDPWRRGALPRAWMVSFSYRRRSAIKMWLRDGRYRGPRAKWAWWSRRGWRCRRFWVRLALVGQRARPARRR
jgi:hypothetical protein